MGGAIGTFNTRVPDRLDGERADRVVAVLSGLSRAAARRAIERGAATFDGEVVAAKARVPAGAVVEVDMPDELPGLEAEPVAFEVRHEDDHLAVVDKPAGMVVHPGAGNRDGTLAAGLLHRWPQLAGVGDPDRWGIVHRLDKDTSGLLVVAKTPGSLRALRRDLGARRIGRHYAALVAGAFQIATGTIDAPLGRDPRRPTRFAIRQEGRPARTHYRRVAAWNAPVVTLLDVTLETGRTHQIRVHLRSIDRPVVGDSVYGKRLAPPIDPGRVWLHAARLELTHPVTGRELVVVAPLPADLQRSLAALGSPAEGEVV